MLGELGIDNKIKRKYAFADPPYLYCGNKHYGKLHAEAYLYDDIATHKKLIDNLVNNYDGFVYCLSSTTLHEILPLCPKDIRICSWVKPFAVFKPNVNPGYTWEPVLLYNPRSKRCRSEDTVKDHLICNITLKKGLVGAKPLVFCKWVLNLLGVTENDVIDDIFPGTGIMQQAIDEHNQIYKSDNQLSLF